MMKNKQVWILTFNRPLVLSRQIKTWGRQGYDVHVFSNYPELQWNDNETSDYVKTAHFNSLSYKDSNSWCARSWNSIFIKAFMDGAEDSVFVQDDTECHPDWPKVLEKQIAEKNLDFVWGPAGDTFFWMKKDVLKRVGWFDERYLGCYCGDADFMLRVWTEYIQERDKLSIEETHDWGWIHNPIGIRNHIRWDLASKCGDATYINQHEEMEGKFRATGNYVLDHSQAHFRNQWKFKGGNGINGIGALRDQPNIEIPSNIDWYPWFTQKYLMKGSM